VALTYLGEELPQGRAADAVKTGALCCDRVPKPHAHSRPAADACLKPQC